MAFCPYQIPPFCMISCALKGINTAALSVRRVRVILSLLSNANSYGYSDSDIDIYIKDTHNSSNILLDIVNKSSYIPDDALSDVFAKFKQAKYAKFRKTGTGLGLYLSKQIIDAHGGEIHASSDQANETSTFGFSIPKTQSDKSQLMINND